MVERLKIAIKKARAQRGGLGPAQPPQAAQPAPAPSRPAEPRSDYTPPPQARGHVEGPTPPAVAGAQPGVDRLWSAIEPIELDPQHLIDNRVITLDKSDPTYIAFDVLRTRISRVFKKHGWTRLGITSPTKGCGKTFVTANLGLSFARSGSHRTVMMDMDLRLPALAKTMGVKRAEKARWFLDGGVPPETYLRLVGENLAIGLNRERLRDAGEVILDPSTSEVLDDMQGALRPDLIIYDLPPVLSCDDVIGFLPQLDSILLVIAADETKPEAVTECERLLSETNLLGVLLNKAEDVDSIKYGYEYA